MPAWHGLIKAVGAHQLDRCVEELAELRAGEDLFLGAVGEHGPFFQQHDARHLGRDLVNVVGDEDDSLPRLHEAADDVEVLKAGLEVEAAGRLIQQQCIGIADQGAAEQEPALFPGGHRGEGAVFQLGHPEPLHDVLGTGAVVGAELLMRPGVRARIVAGQDDAQAAHVAPILVLKIVRDDAEVGPQVEEVPALLAEEPYGAALALDGIDIARQQLEQGRFAGAVGSKDGGLASDRDVERQVVEDAGAAPIGADVLDLDDVLHGCGSYLA